MWTGLLPMSRGYLGMVLSFVVVSLASHEVLKMLMGTSHPICLVRSNSMAPAYVNGDVLFVYNGTQVRFQVGQVIVFKVRLVVGLDFF